MRLPWLIPVFFDKQILPGTFEYTLSHLIDSKLDLSVFDSRYRNDKEGAPAYDPRILLKIILFAYSKGIISSRKIALACREHIIFMALSACTCPAGKKMYVKNRNFEVDGRKGIVFMGWITECRECSLKRECLRYPDQTVARQVCFFNEKKEGGELTFTEKMKRKIDSDAGRHIYSGRIGTVEPVFANIRHIIGLDRFTLRGKKKVTGQWRLYCIVHNLLKVHRYGEALAG